MIGLSFFVFCFLFLFLFFEEQIYLLFKKLLDKLIYFAIKRKSSFHKKIYFLLKN